MATELQRVKLKPGRAKPLWYGHPWVYSEAVERADQITPGDEVQIVDHDGRFIGRGFANPRSQIFVRIAERADRPLDEGWLRSRLHAARSLRARLRLPSAETDAYRLVNSEGDGLPGLIVDVFGDSAVVQLTTMGMKRREAEIFAAVTELLRPRTLYEASSGGAAQKVEGFVAQARVVAGESRPEVPCRENGAALVVEPLVGQKTGWFLDQRENRAFVAGLARGARVLDLYTYAGGFALAAALGGAAKITAVDVSPRALERAGKNFALNGIDSARARRGRRLPLPRGRPRRRLRPRDLRPAQIRARAQGPRRGAARLSPTSTPSRSPPAPTMPCWPPPAARSSSTTSPSNACSPGRPKMRTAPCKSYTSPIRPAITRYR
jgi:23S rRNA G2069 N7-methylase RlmK/C1962 C5-methylase RlmI